MAVERDTRLAQKVYQQYLTFFDKAERERRWHPIHDIPWEKINRELPEALVLNAETFCCVESYLPDYVAGGINVVRKSFGQAWFSANWGYEESKHSIALMEYLMRSGRRSPEHMFDLQAQLMEKEWRLPFTTARQMTVYGCFQEQATFVIYCRQEAAASQAGDEALRTIFRLNARDEIAHARFYEDVIKLLLEEDREATVLDIAWVAKHFEMPGVGIVPDYESRVQVMRDVGHIDRDLFLQKVYFPVLKYLGVTREELVAAAGQLRKMASASANGAPVNPATV
ncbi:MAG: acyl-ACP desaturase [Myxococcales bacterium]|nr:acyl-ACP desaturase [Myxococcales bacterium]